MPRRIRWIAPLLPTRSWPKPRQIRDVIVGRSLVWMARVRRNEYTLFGRYPAILYNHKYISKICILPSENKKRGRKRIFPTRSQEISVKSKSQKKFSGLPPQEHMMIYWHTQILHVWNIFTYIYHRFLKPNVVNIPYMEHMGYDDMIDYVLRTLKWVIKVQGRLFRGQSFTNDTVDGRNPGTSW